uniref:Uncharacterized protein n=1 Tax=Romanomermis culicivorax TaxID=13658 RepID=A0A915KGE1_ROMCU
MEEYNREPCPWRIVDDCGGAFAMGCVGGSLFHAVRQGYKAPKGISSRLSDALVGLRTGGPKVG